MSEARHAILSKLRSQYARSAPDEDAAHRRVAARLYEHPASLVPARGQLDRPERIELFIEMAKSVKSDVQRLSTMQHAPAAVSHYLREHNLPQKVTMAPSPVLDAAHWDSQPLLRVRRGTAEPQDEVGLTLAAAGVAETGTLMLISDQSTPTMLAYLPETSIVMLMADDVEGAYEQAWDRLRANLGAPPRSVNFITGPSRTGDIAQKIELGAHGPKRLLVLLVDQHPAEAAA